MAWYGNINEINIWKEDSRNVKLTNSKRKQVQGINKVITFYMGEQLLKTEIEMLNLSQRSLNCLKRVGWKTIGDILAHIEQWTDLKKVRNLGNTSAIEIITRLEEYQQSLIGVPPKETKVVTRRRSQDLYDLWTLTWGH